MYSTTERPKAPVLSRVGLSFAEMRADAARRAPMVRSVPLSSLEVHAGTDDDIYLKYGVDHLALEPKALQDFARILGVTGAAMRRITSDHGQRGVKLIDALRTARATGVKTKQRAVYLTVDKNKLVHRVTGEGTNKLDHTAFFDIVEGYLNTDNFTFDDYHAGDDGRIEIILRAPGEFEITGYQRERFLPGVSLKLRPAGLTATHHAIRVLCDNGVTVPDVFNPVYGHGAHTLRRADDMTQWLTSMSAVRNNGYRDPAFDKRVAHAIGTTASVAELIAIDSEVRRIISGGDTEANIQPDEIARFVDLRPTVEGFTKAGMSFELVGPAEAPHLKTDRTVWDLVNGVTDLASHDYGFKGMTRGDRSELRAIAGRLLMNPFDLEFSATKQAF